jgi:F0F1-type ATP synthase assembly protein I
MNDTNEPVDNAPESAVSRDMVRRGLLVAPLLLVVSGVIWGTEGVSGSAYGLAIVLVNFIFAAGIITITAPRSLPLLMGSVMVGYVARLGLIFIAVLPVRDSTWISIPSLCATMLMTHLGLLVWELRHVSMSLAYPGLKPKKSSPL